MTMKMSKYYNSLYKINKKKIKKKFFCLSVKKFEIVVKLRVTLLNTKLLLRILLLNNLNT